MNDVVLLVVWPQPLIDIMADKFDILGEVSKDRLQLVDSGEPNLLILGNQVESPGTIVRKRTVRLHATRQRTIARIHTLEHLLALGTKGCRNVRTDI